ncbi:hypothetical protein HN512_04070 [Candidatus Peregrinibacteria bacterium]|jgi:hypothetical protein|nr:hypothetical protein [Candidatus Peregrinibacteria bacterium]MBT3598986.1 hypothetical protein [Candidatus Peregrinibacteria bacterium]MBT4366982.1 hypothetical protein [Candidatus Peregrinibacteria bacterium]MBT4585488.1 hypothetical protein [Candidatus Peregrinibacteria bacterium]MBT6731303.1 hypothetical protein [Candidatus Peregrinibacteria bacterium]
MTNSIQRRDHISSADTLQATDITAGQKDSNVLDIGDGIYCICDHIGKLVVLDATGVFEECDRIREGCE